MGSSKIVLLNLVENDLVDTVGEGEDGMSLYYILIYIHYHM